MNEKDSIKYLEKCIDKSSEEYLYLISGNPKLEKAIKKLLKRIKEGKK